MSTLRTFHVDGIAHQVLFTTNASGGRLCKPRDDRELEAVIVTRCELLDDRMRVVADGQAVCAETDTFDFATGAELALDRMLAEAECYVRGWRVDDSLAVLDAYDDATGPAARPSRTAYAPPLREPDATVAARDTMWDDFGDSYVPPPPAMNMFDASAVYKDVLRRQVERQVAEALVDALTDTYIHPAGAAQ